MRKSARFQYTREGVTCFIDIVADQVSAVEEGTDGYRKWCTLWCAHREFTVHGTREEVLKALGIEPIDANGLIPSGRTT